MKSSPDSHNHDNVVDMFTGKSLQSIRDTRFVRLSPELDGLEVLYSNDTHFDKLFSLKILCWGLRANGDVVGLVPWLSDIIASPDISDPLNGHWEGYYDPGIDEIFTEPPIHKVVELETAAEYYEIDSEEPEEVIQELPDTIGTHAVLASDDFTNITLTEVISWRLLNNGDLHGMLADESKVEATPILPGDGCLYTAQDSEHFKYFFQHQIANKIKAEDPEALAAISLLVDKS